MILKSKIASLWVAVLLVFLITPATRSTPASANLQTPISLQFADIELTELLQILAKLGSTNFLLSESIKGKITVDLQNTPWHTALHSILASRGLRIIRNGDIYWIGPHAEIVAFQKFRREDAALPFGGDHINSPRQILIEARIVEADERFARELGAKLNHQASALNGNPENKMSSNFDLSGSGLNGFNPAAVAATLVSKNASRLLQIELSALESEGQGKILSNPRIMTGDQVKATIEQGTELPYQMAAASGATAVAFRKANLKLEVMPQITPEGQVVLNLDIHKDSVGQLTPAGYAIDTKHVNTQVLVDDGGTVMIGGIYETTALEDAYRVPWLADVPWLGALFRNQRRTQTRQELLVFITPKMLEPSAP